MASPTERQVVDWLKDLGRLIAPTMPPKEVSDRLTALVPLLVNRYGSICFDSVSREHVARQCRFFPSYAELCDALDSLPSRAPQAAIAGPDIDGLDDMDRAWVAFYHRRVDELGQATMYRWGSYDADLDNLRSLIQAQSRRAWAVICPESVVIQDRPSDAQIVAVARALRMPGGPLAGSAMPQDEPLKPRPSPVSGEALRAMRAARGIAVPEMSADDVYGEAVPA